MTRGRAVALPGGPRLAALLAVLILLLILAAVVRRTTRSGPEQSYIERGIAATASHDLPGAISSFEDAVRANPRSGRSYELLADAYLAAGKVARALDVLDRLRTFDPHRPHLATRIAEAYIPIDNVYCLRWAREAALLEPRSPKARAVLALGLVRAGDARDASAELALAEQLAQTSSPGAFAGRSEGMFRLGVTPKQLTDFLLQRISGMPYEKG